MRWLVCINPACPNHDRNPHAQFLIADGEATGLYSQEGAYLRRADVPPGVPGHTRCARCEQPAVWIENRGVPEDDLAKWMLSDEIRYLRDAMRHWRDLRGKPVSAWQELSDPIMDRFEEDAAELAREADISIGAAAAMIFAAFIERVAQDALLPGHEPLVRDPSLVVEAIPEEAWERRGEKTLKSSATR